MSRDYASDLIDITCHLHFDTGKAVRVSLDGEDKNAVWLPHAWIEMKRLSGALVLITLPEGKAIEKGLEGGVS